MKTTDYLKAVGKFNDSYDGDWSILATNKDGSLFLVKDSNNICYVSTSDLVAMMPYGMALVGKTIINYAADSPRKEVMDAVKSGEISPDCITGIDLADEDVVWLSSEDISGMVRSIEHNN